MAVGILLSLLGFVLWLVVDLRPLARSPSGRAAATFVGSVVLAAAYLRVEPLGASLDLPFGLRILGWLSYLLGIALLVFSLFVEIPLRVRAQARAQRIRARRGADPLAGHGASLARAKAAATPAPVEPKEPVLVTSGTYALCRHPGVLWLVFVLVGGVLHADRAGLIWLGLLWLGLDVLYVAVQDRIIFPARFSGYRAYQRTTPFLIPTRDSLRRFLLGAQNDPAAAKNQ